MAEQVEFGIRIPDVFKAGFTGYFKNIVPLTLAALATLAVYGIFRYEAQQAFDQERDFASIAIDLVGLVVAGTISYPWYYYALQAARGEKVELGAPFYYMNRFGHQFVGSAFFWAGVLFGVRYGRALAFLPALVIMMFYAFHGYVVADTPPNKEGMRGGTYALGTSVRLGDKRRFGLFAIACLFMLLNFVGAMTGLAFLQRDPDAQITGIATVVIGLAITTSITMVSGAYMYDELKEKLGDHRVPASARSSSKRKKKSKGKRRG